MRKFNRGNKGSSGGYKRRSNSDDSKGYPRGRDRRRSGSKERFSRRNDRRPKEIEMHEVVCDECGKNCEVPFKPSNDKPIYCRDCFKKKDGGREKGRSEAPSNELKEINRKLDLIMEKLEIN